MGMIITKEKLNGMLVIYGEANGCSVNATVTTVENVVNNEELNKKLHIVDIRPNGMYIEAVKSENAIVRVYIKEKKRRSVDIYTLKSETENFEDDKLNLVYQCLKHGFKLQDAGLEFLKEILNTTENNVEDIE